MRTPECHEAGLVISARRQRDLLRDDRRLDRLVLARARMTDPADLAALARDVDVVQRRVTATLAGPALEPGDLRCE
jgi:hypothetical protein